MVGVVLGVLLITGGYVLNIPLLYLPGAIIAVVALAVRGNGRYQPLEEKCRNCGGYGHSEVKCMRGYGIFDRMK
ncbi:MAG: hypothetical protein AB7I38_12030 [Dehalococcoidia bacterium]